MPLSCGARALKFSLFVFNLVFLLSGVVCLCLGTWLIIDKYALDNLAAATAKVKGYENDDGLRDLATKPVAVRQIGFVLLFGGLTVIVVAFLGCCGAAKEWRPLLCCYATCLMCILAVEIAAAIYAISQSHMFSKDFRPVLHALLKAYNGTDNPNGGQSDELLVKTAFDKLMTEKSCCGVDSKVGEFNETGWYRMTGGRDEFPPACCPPDRKGRLLKRCPRISRHSHGCYRKIEESFQAIILNFKFVAWTVVFIALIQGCFHEVFNEMKPKYSAIIASLIISSSLTIISFISSILLFRRIRIEMLYYY